MPPVSRLVRDAAGQWRRAAEGDRAAIAFIRERFPAAADLLHKPDRRQFMRLMAASLALSGLAGCDDDPHDEIVPPVNQAEGSAPASVLTYASSTLIDGFANGVLVKTRDGRPIKIEGNPGHPWSRGGTDVFGQASVLGLYDPFRSQSVQFDTRESDWAAFRAAMVPAIAQWGASAGKGLAVLIGPSTSPSLAAQLAAWQRALPEMRLYSHVPVTREPLYESSIAAYGTPLETSWRLAGARRIVCLDGDLLDAGPHQVGVARDWADARRACAARGELLEMWAASSVPNLTSAKADHPIAASPALIARMAEWLVEQAAGSGTGTLLPPNALRWCQTAWRALDEARGDGLLVAGLHASQAVHEAVQRLNTALGNDGRLVVHTVPLLIQARNISVLAADMSADRVQTLLMLDTNPVYDAPADLDFAAKLGRVTLKIHAGLYADETALNVDWHLPTTHPLECWGDAYALDGTACLIQPTIKPLYDGRSLPEIVSLFADVEPRQGLDLLRSHWVGANAPGTEAFWKQALLSGVFGGGASPPVTVQAAPIRRAPPAFVSDGPVLVFRPDPTVWDGIGSDNAWLQELPKPITKTVWENAVGIGPGLAARQHLQTGDVVQVEAGGRMIEGPVWILNGQPDDVVSLTLGYGRNVAGQLSAGLGYNAYALRRSDGPWLGGAVTLHCTGNRRTLATTQDPTSMEGHDFVRVQHAGAAPVGDGTYRPPTLYPDHQSDGRAWGMVIDLDTCIGCNACVTACQSENNISVVGRDEVLNGRWMHWLRVDLYEAPSIEAPSEDAAPLAPVHFMPVPCMHCEQAPCEVGCPVEATLHDHEGLNLMVYNRCIGTRACSGYCPYKVRRFNYADYAEAAAPSIVEQRNPDVTVRARGVMEKCTYCVQRIADARARSDRENTPIRDGEVRTACQDACPTRAITFGDLAVPDSEVSQAHADPRRYALLGELNTRPRTTYLAARARAAGAT